MYVLDTNILIDKIRISLCRCIPTLIVENNVIKFRNKKLPTLMTSKPFPQPHNDGVIIFRARLLKQYKVNDVALKHSLYLFLIRL